MSEDLRQISVDTYYNNESNNIEVNIGNLTLWFSYKTVVGFSAASGTFYRQNDWSITTGKHLNKICPNKKARLPGAEFETKLLEALKVYELKV